MNRNISAAAWDALENEIIDIVLEESQQDPLHMNMSLIVDGLDCIHPFSAAEDERIAELAWQEFRNRHNIPKVLRSQRRRSRGRSLLLIAALAMLLATGICYALGIDLWNIAFRWTRDTLTMWLYPTSAVETAAVETMPAENDRAREIWGDDIYELMEEHGICVSLPEWMPAELTCVGLDQMVYEGGAMIFADYLSKDDLSVHLRVSDNKNYGIIHNVFADIEASEDLQEIIEIGKNRFYVMNNLDQISVSWIEGTCEVFIQGDVTFDILNRIIQSVPN